MVGAKLICRYEARHRGLGSKKLLFSVAYLLNGPSCKLHLGRLHFQKSIQCHFLRTLVQRIAFFSLFLVYNQRLLSVKPSVGMYLVQLVHICGHKLLKIPVNTKILGTQFCK